MFRVCAACLVWVSSSEAQWLLQQSLTSADLRGISAVSASVAWASGSKGTIIRTTDGGEHWRPCTVPDELAGGAGLDFRGIQAWDADTAVVMASGEADKSRLYRTTDGCISWTLLRKNTDPEGFYDAFWLNARNGAGMLLGDPVKSQFTVLTTENGGRTWVRDGSESLQLKGSTLAAFAASNSSIVRGSRQGRGRAVARLQYAPGFVTGGQSGAFLFERWSTSPGADGLRAKSWIRHELPLATGSASRGAFAAAAQFRGNNAAPSDIVVVGGDYRKPNESAGTAAISVDGGRTWAASVVPPHGYRSTVEWSVAIRAWITAGTNGSDLSRDGGRTWQAIDNGNWNALSLPFAVGPKGRIAKLRIDLRGQ